MKIGDLGNIYKSGGVFTTKAALLQSLYRCEMNEPCGETTVRDFIGFDEDGKKKYGPVRRAYGHLVEGGAAANKNFFYTETFEYAKQRVKNKKKEETIGVDRLFNNLLSSMPMAFNLFHPLMMMMSDAANDELVTKIVSALFPGLGVNRVMDIGIEFIPTPIENYTNDKSAMDAFIAYVDADGEKCIIAIECKYTDSLGTNKASDNEKKLAVAIKSDLFTEAGIEHICNGCTQIYRNFLLTESYRMVHDLQHSVSVILAPKDHPTTAAEINSLKQYLKPQFTENKLHKYALEDFTETIANNVTDAWKPWIEWFQKRYLAFHRIENLYHQLPQ
ncbi:MAG: hypothetical protein KF744_17570 [Taibaiella sp.]|nr:hypothetical protein [Taibaiella sp.]